MDPDGWLELLDRLDLKLAPQAKYKVSPILGYLFGFTKQGVDHTKQSHWAAAIECRTQKAIDSEQYLDAIEQNSGIYAKAKCLKEGSKTIIQRVEELVTAQAGEDAYLAKNAPVPIEVVETLKNLAAGYYAMTDKRYNFPISQLVKRVPHSLLYFGRLFITFH